MIHTVKGSSVVKEAEVNIFLEFPCFACDPVIVGSLISGSSAFPKHQLVHLKVLSSHTVETQLEGVWALPCWHVKWVQLYGILNFFWHCLSLSLEWKLNWHDYGANPQNFFIAKLNSIAIKQLPPLSTLKHQTTIIQSLLPWISLLLIPRILESYPVILWHTYFI